MIHNREQLVGRWFRNEIDDNGNSLAEYCYFTIDGSFEFTFISLNGKGDIVEQVTEVGDWGLVGDIHFTITHEEIVNEEVFPADLTLPDNYHAYKVLLLSADIFHYQHITSQESFILKRVVDNIGHC